VNILDLQFVRVAVYVWLDSGCLLWVDSPAEWEL